MCLCSPSSIIWYLARAFMLKAPYCWQRHRVQWTRGYCTVVLRWCSDCIELRYKSSALPFLPISRDIISWRMQASAVCMFICQFQLGSLSMKPVKQFSDALSLIFNHIIDANTELRQQMTELKADRDRLAADRADALKVHVNDFCTFDTCYSQLPQHNIRSKSM